MFDESLPFLCRISKCSIELDQHNSFCLKTNPSVETPGEQQTLRELSASVTTKEEHNEICCNRSICPPEKQTAQTRESNSKKLKITLSTGIKSSLMEALVFMVL